MGTQRALVKTDDETMQCISGKKKKNSENLTEVCYALPKKCCHNVFTYFIHITEQLDQFVNYTKQQHFICLLFIHSSLKIVLYIFL